MAVKTLAAEIKELRKYPTLQPTADSLDIPATAPDDTNGCDYVATGREVVMLYNSGASPYTFSLISVADGYNRTGDITNYSIGAGEFAALIPPVAGFAGAGGKVQITVSNVAVKFLVVRVPNVL